MRNSLDRDHRNRSIEDGHDRPIPEQLLVVLAVRRTLDRLVRILARSLGFSHSLLRTRLLDARQARGGRDRWFDRLEQIPGRRSAAIVSRSEALAVIAVSPTAPAEN
jgi:hypothetical protein